MADFIENFIETVLFGSRWLLAPFYIGLVGALVILLVKFVAKFLYIIPNIADASGTELILNILGLIDIVLIANLLLMIILSGYENFVSKIDAIKGHVDRPEWMGKVDYAGLKLKVISSIVAISSIELLKVFIHISEEGDKNLYTGNSLWEMEVFWLIILHLTFVFSGLVFALTEKNMHHPHN
ncbi:MAG TPA: TIGR00645 family protein [Thioploca sp.]|nr:TIGR00645 family protein [Thioploca sp.]